MEMENSCIILRRIAIVGAAENGVQIGISKSFGSIHNALVGSYNDLDIILNQKIFDSFDSKANDFPQSQMRPVLIDLILSLVYVRNRVGPKNVVHYFLVRFRKILVIDFKGFLYFL